MSIDLIGWDIGGAHLKAAGLSGETVAAVIQRPCPLWQGLDYLHAAIGEILQDFAPSVDCTHGITMTGELADLFESREQGVRSLIEVFRARFAEDRLKIFAGSTHFLRPGPLTPESATAVASANWRATGMYVATRHPNALLVDVGSTTSDFLLIQNGELRSRGYSDEERLRYDELVYAGIVRTPLMCLAERVPIAGEWVGSMNEHFATTADVFRLSGELPEHADQMPAADGNEKTAVGSARRLARMVGRDFDAAALSELTRLAGYYRERLMNRLRKACELQWSRGLLDESAPVIGAGIGRFLVQELGLRMRRSYIDFSDLIPWSGSGDDCFRSADCAPAAAVALLMRQTS